MIYGQRNPRLNSGFLGDALLDRLVKIVLSRFPESSGSIIVGRYGLELLLIY